MVDFQCVINTVRSIFDILEKFYKGHVNKNEAKYVVLKRIYNRYLQNNTTYPFGIKDFPEMKNDGKYLNGILSTLEQDGYIKYKSLPGDNKYLVFMITEITYNGLEFCKKNFKPTIIERILSKFKNKGA